MIFTAIQMTWQRRYTKRYPPTAIPIRRSELNHRQGECGDQAGNLAGEGGNAITHRLERSCALGCADETRL